MQKDMQKDKKGVYYRGSAEDTEDVLDFANMAFSMEYGGEDFEALYPKAYAQGRCQLLTHHIIREGNKIRALVDSYPLTLRQADCEVRAAYLGTVCVHPKSRGKGYMIELMKQAEASARAEGCSLMLLDGDRHRYRHFGFEKAGIKYSFHIGWRNICHCCNNMQHSSVPHSSVQHNTVHSGMDGNYRFELLEPESERFDANLDAMYALYMRRFVTARSRDDFYWCLQSERAEAYAILQGTEVVGYFSGLEEGSSVFRIFELELKEYSRLPKAVYGMMEEFGANELSVAVGMDEVEKIEYLDKMSDYYTVGMSHQIRILNYQKTLEFLFRWKQKYGTPAAGEYVIGITKTDAESHARSGQENYLIKIAEGVATVQKTDAPANLVLEEMELVRTLTTSYWFHSQGRAQSPLKEAPDGWFPLPFFLPNADAF